MVKVVKQKSRWILRSKVAEGEEVDPWGHNEDLENIKQPSSLMHISPVLALA